MGVPWTNRDGIRECIPPPAPSTSVTPCTPPAGGGRGRDTSAGCPFPPHHVAVLREHLAASGTADVGRLFFSEQGPVVPYPKDRVKGRLLRLTGPVDAGLIRAPLRGVGPAAQSGRLRRGQRVAVARALAPRPRLPLLDEPTSALDRATADVVLDAIGELAAEGTCVVMSSHRPEEVASRCTQPVEMDAGRCDGGHHREIADRSGRTGPEEPPVERHESDAAASGSAAASGRRRRPSAQDQGELTLSAHRAPWPRGRRP